MSTRSRWLVAVVALVVLVPVGFVLARQHIKLGFKIQVDPLGYVHVVDKGRPITADVDALLRELDATTGVRWTPGVYQDWNPSSPDAAYATNAKARRALSRSLRLPDETDFRVIGVAANTHQTRSAARDGVLYVIWFNTPADAENWLMTDPPIFTDIEVEAQRTTYWAGKFVAYYAPSSEGRDWSREVQQAVEAFAA